MNQGRKGAATLLAAVTDMNRSVAACQLGITVASLALGFVSEPAIHGLIQPLLAGLPDEWTRALSILITLSLITYMHVVFGEQMPKLAALQATESVGLWVARPVTLFGRVTGPLISLMNGSSAWMLRRLGYKADGEEGEIHTVEELRLLVEDSEEAGEIDADAADMVLNVFALADKIVRDCMVPRDKMAALDVNTPPDKVLELTRLGAHTRLPVYDGTPDKIVGIVKHQRPVLPVQHVGRGGAGRRAVPGDVPRPGGAGGECLPAVPQVAPADGASPRRDRHSTRSAHARRRVGRNRRRHRGRTRRASAEAEARSPPRDRGPIRAVSCAEAAWAGQACRQLNENTRRRRFTAEGVENAEKIGKAMRVS